uniref:Uncharacterized protein n=1 Tax=Solanum lycopersicum TaxID=4081 RepID=K4C497_SOLLC
MQKERYEIISTPIVLSLHSGFSDIASPSLRLLCLVKTLKKMVEVIVPYMQQGVIVPCKDMKI